MSDVVYIIQVFWGGEYEYMKPEAYITLEDAEEAAEELQEYLDQFSDLYQVEIDKLYIIE